MSEYMFKTDREIMTCQECPIVKKYRLGTICPLREGAERRYGTCPLVEVPPHGRLGDLDKAIDIIRKASEFQKTRAASGAFSRGIADGYDRVVKMLENTQIVLEASN